MNTEFLSRTKEKCGQHKGKVAATAGGGLSLAVAYQLFVTESHFQQHRQDEKEARQQDHVLLMENDVRIDALQSNVMWLELTTKARSNSP